MLVYTSVTRSYLPKARVLAESLARWHPDWTFAVILSDVLPDDWDPAAWPFDHVVPLSELGIPDWKRWAFGHSVVELCTAVKGRAAVVLAERTRSDRIMYLDPDIRVCGSLQPLCDLLDEHDVLLTPHLLDAETSRAAIVDNEICTLRHGVYNLGFFAARTSGQGRSFIDWWSDRLGEFCISDIPNGLFTDQRWCDLAPCFFDRLHIVRDRGCNVATWNVAHRHITRTPAGEWMAGDGPLRFYHFTGYDSGDGRGMLERYASDQPAAFRLWDDYREELAAAGHGEPRFGGWEYARFSNGRPITADMRRLYRSRPDLQKAFPDPYLVEGLHCYYEWWQAEVRAGRIESGGPQAEASAGPVRTAIRAAATQIRGVVGEARRTWASRGPLAAAITLGVPCLSVLVAVATVLLAIYGAVRHFSPVPAWDMWHGGVGFFLGSGDPAAWWSPHNEHRIVLAKGLFWLDYALLGGTGRPLVAANYAILAVFASIWAWLAWGATGIPRARRVLCGTFLVAWSFQWMQNGNMVWPFQVGFLLAYLVPLLSFLAMGAGADRRSDAGFRAAVLGGVLSVGTIANGLLAMPLLAAMSAVLGYSRRRVAALVALSCCTWGAYFWDAPRLAAAGRTTDLVSGLQRAWSLACYVCLFLGSPFYHWVGGGQAGLTVGIVAGLLACGIVLWLLRDAVTARGPARGTGIALATFALYVVASGIATGLGRLDAFGIEQATTYRYTTPAVMLWAALVCAAARSPRCAALWHGRTAVVLLVAAECMLLNRQWDAVRWPNGHVFDKAVGGLALALGVQDESALAAVHPRPRSITAVAEAARGARMSIFRYPPFTTRADIDARTTDTRDLPPAQGSVDRVTSPDAEDRFVRIEGWAVAPGGEQPSWGRVVADDGRVVGAVVFGGLRADVEAALGPRARQAGFAGYVLRDTHPFSVILMGTGPLGRLDAR